MRLLSLPATTVRRQRADARSTDPPRLLVLGSLAYVVVPAALQLAFWLRPALAVMTVLGFVLVWPALVQLGGQKRAGLSWQLPAAVGVAVAVLAGAGGFFAHSGDWRKHYALLRDLSTEAWPVVYQLPESDAVLNYSLGWYMPAAIVGRTLGWTAANVALWAWLATGVGLVVWWVVELVGRRRAALVFLFFSGLDVVGAIVLPRISDWWAVSDDTIETWPGEWQVPSVLRSFLEAPQHSVPTMVVGGLVLSGRMSRLPVVVQFMVLACLAVSSPFAVVAVLPFVAFFSLKSSPLRAPLPVVVGSGAVIAAVVLLYAARLAGPPAGMPNEVTVGLTFLDPRFPVLGSANLATSFVLVLVLELAVVAAAVLFASRPGHNTRMLVVLSAMVFVICLTVRVGHNNDLAMRGPGMAVFVLSVLAAKALVFPKPTVAWRVLLVVVCLGAVTGLVEVRRNLTAEPFGAYSVTSSADTAGLVEMKDRWYPDRASLLSQYLVATDGPAGRILSLN